MTRSLKELKRAVEKVEPYLRRRVWANITSYLIPSVLESADALILEIECCTDTDEAERIELLSRLSLLRQGFRRVRPFPESPTIH